MQDTDDETKRVLCELRAADEALFLAKCRFDEAQTAASKKRREIQRLIGDTQAFASTLDHIKYLVEHDPNWNTSPMRNLVGDPFMFRYLVVHILAIAATNGVKLP